MLKLVVLLVSVSSILAQVDRSSFNKPKLYLTKDNGEDLINPATDPFDGLSYRLPNETKPIHYDISIITNIHINEPGFIGKVGILIEAVDDTDEIVIHYRQTTITNIDLFDASKTIIEYDVAHDSEDDVEFLKIKPQVALVKDSQYYIEITYQGSLRSDNVGFYRSTYTNGEGKVVQLASTKFEPHNARHAFPCYDEPWIRATYAIQIRHGANFTAISNMPEESRTVDPNDSEYVITKFELLPSVQSYLVAFMISDLAHADDDSTSVPHRIFAKPQSIANNEADLALEVSGKILDGFSEYFGVSYTLPKMDQVGFPTFVSGAMENWGMVTYREQYLIFNNQTSTAGDRENVMTIIAHEFTHQWTGNLVSPIWWQYLWLNEGFAAFYENYILNFVFENERWMDTFLIDTVQSVMVSDSSPTVRPMSSYVESPEKVSSLFDFVSYSKSASVLRTFESAFGADVWREGMNNYLKARSLNYASPEHLHAEIQKAVDSNIPENRRINVDQAMKSWEMQSGFPYLTVSREGDTLYFEQNRFMYENRDSTNLWWIPISYYTSSSPSFDSTADFWLAGFREGQVSQSQAPKPFIDAKWLIVNTQETGYYRVNYDHNLWQGIIEQLNEDASKIHTLNRAQLIDDSFHFARADLLEYDTLFWIMNYLRDETDYIPWAAANRAHTFISKRISTGLTMKSFQKFMRENVDKLFTRLGVNSIEGEQRVDRYARNIAINIACYHQHATCLSLTNEKLIEHYVQHVNIEPDLINVIHCNGMRQMDQQLYGKIISVLMSSESNTERTRIVSNFDCIQDEELYLSALMLSVNATNNLSAAERSRIISTVPRNGKSLLSVYEIFVLDNYAALNTLGLLSSALSVIADQVSDDDSYTMFADTLLTLKTAGVLTDSQIVNYMRTGRANHEWQNANEEAIKTFFGQLEGTETSSTPDSTTMTDSTTSSSSSTTSGSTTPTSTPSTTTTDAATSHQISAVFLIISLFITVTMKNFV